MKILFNKSSISSNSSKVSLQTIHHFSLQNLSSLITDSRDNQLTFITSCQITLVRCSSTVNALFSTLLQTTVLLIVLPLLQQFHQPCRKTKTKTKTTFFFPGLLKIRASCSHLFIIVFSPHFGSSKCQVAYSFVKTEPLSSHQILCQFVLAIWQIISKCTGLRQEFCINSCSAVS